jgi:hypothetical protein
MGGGDGCDFLVGSDGDNNIQGGDDNDDIYGMMLAIAAAPTKELDICRIFSVFYLLLNRI